MVGADLPRSTSSVEGRSLSPPRRCSPASWAVSAESCFCVCRSGVLSIVRTVLVGSSVVEGVSVLLFCCGWCKKKNLSAAALASTRAPKVKRMTRHSAKHLKGQHAGKGDEARGTGDFDAKNCIYLFFLIPSVPGTNFQFPCPPLLNQNPQSAG